MKKKGFTLIELLAVIVILAIIALVATPIVLNLVEKARKGAFARSAEGVVNAAKTYYLEKQVDMQLMEDIIFTCDNIECKEGDKKLNVEGNVGEGIVIVKADGKISLVLTNNKYCAVKYETAEKIKVTKGNCSDIDITKDTTKPVIEDVIVTIGEDNESITIEVKAKDEESGIHHYEYSIDGGTTYVQANENKKTYTKLTGNSYQIKVRVYNGTYGKTIYTEETGMAESDVKEIELKKTYIVTFDPNGGTLNGDTSKTVIYNGSYGELPIPTYTGYTFMGWYTSATDGTKIEESTPVTITENQTLYAQWKLACSNTDDNGNCMTTTVYTTGDAIKLGGYKWHVIADTGTNLTLLMDANQLGENSTMRHCTNDTDASTDCGVSGSSYVYSWNKSLIRDYLNSTFLDNLQGKITNEILETQVCSDPSRSGGKETYGGYLMSELSALNKTCSNVVTDKVRLISPSEYYNMSPNYTGTNDNYPNVGNYIIKLSKSSTYSSWLYCNSSSCGASNGWWWTMGSSSSSYTADTEYAQLVLNTGVIYGVNGQAKYGVRPVITIIK